MDQEKIGKFIAEQRKAKKLTQEELASMLGVSNRSVSNWENGKNMPDLSLFNPLCEILEISINELLSGSCFYNKEYLDRLENELVNFAINDRKIMLKKIERIFLAMFLLLLILFILFYFYHCYEINVKYDARTMKCNIEDGILTYTILGNSVLNTDYITRTIDNKTYLIFHSTINTYNVRRSNWEYAESFADLISEKNVTYGFYWHFDQEISKQEEIVYYTNKSLNKIKKLTDKELLQEIKKSFKMCSNEVEK